jgi:hypothetical protein
MVELEEEEEEDVVVVVVVAVEARTGDHCESERGQVITSWSASYVFPMGPRIRLILGNNLRIILIACSYPA